MIRHPVRILKYLLVIGGVFVVLTLFSNGVMKSRSDEMSMLEKRLEILKLQNMNQKIPLPIGPDEVSGSDKEKDLIERRNALLKFREDRLPGVAEEAEVNIKDLHRANLPKEEKEKMDWHDYVRMEKDLMRTGNGENSRPVVLTDVDLKEKTLKQSIFKANGFNGYVSDKIALDRSLRDLRPSGCRDKRYWNQLPTASVVVPFYNEHWSTLLRTVYSVINRAPESLLIQVVLVDDGSTKEDLKKNLDDYVAEHFHIVTVVRLKEREGLIRARLAGARAATGDVLLFLDSHVEACDNYLPPLLEPISEDYRTVVCPQIDIIDSETFAIRPQDGGARGAFDWSFFYKRLPKLPQDKVDSAANFKSPVMAGGLFAISTKWFWELGGYDSGLDIWGAEQYEISFKIWQCGGQMYDTPCSRFGHIFRKFSPFPASGKGNYYVRNHRRVAEVWMDDWKNHIYRRNPHWLNVPTGDLTQQKALRNRLRCKPFDWFMKEIAFDLTKHYPTDPPKPFFTGQLRNVQSSHLCIHVPSLKQGGRLVMDNCEVGRTGENFEMTYRGELKPAGRPYCLDASRKGLRAPITLYPCHMQGANQRWKYNVELQQFYHPVTDECLDCDSMTGEVFLNSCNSHTNSQKWTAKNIDSVRVLADFRKP